MTTSQLIPVSMGHIGNAPTLVVDGRTLHTVLEVKRDFSSWMKARVQKYGFVEGQDYEKIINDFSSPKLGNAPANGLPPIDYTLTLDMGKELCMVENNEKGRLTRRYFIECERRALAEAPAPSLPALSTADDRAPLRSLVHAWSQASGMHHSALWPQVKAYFRLSRIDDLPADWIPDALAFVQGKIDALQLAGRKALPARVPAQSPLVSELEVLHRAIDEKRVELMHWARGVDREISRLTGQLYKDVCWSLPNPRRCLDPGIECLHFARHSGVDKLEDGMADLYSALRFATFFARSM